MGNISRNCPLSSSLNYYYILVYESLNNLAPPYMRNICASMFKMYAALTFDQQQTSNYMSQRCIPKVFSFQGPLSGITYHLMQDQLRLYVTLSGFTKRTTKLSKLLVTVHCVYTVVLFVVCLMSVPCNYSVVCLMVYIWYILCSVVPCIYHMPSDSVVFTVYTLYSPLLSVV